MSKRAEELAKQLYPDPKLEDYDDILVYRTDRDNSLMGRVNVVRVYEQAEQDLALTWEDIRLICEIDEDMRCHSDWPLRGQEVYYEEVLRRFREMKDN